MESAEVDLVDLEPEPSPESTNELPKLRPSRMPTGTMPPPIAAAAAQPDWPELVEELLERAEQLDEIGDQIQVLHEVARIYEQELGEPESAFVVMQTALDRDETNMRSCAELQRLAAATDQLSTELCLQLAELYEQAEEHPRAAATYEQIIAIDPRNLAAYHLLARVYQQLGNQDAVVATHRKHAAATPDTAKRIELLVAIGELYATRLHQHDHAIDAYQDALSYDAREPHALEALAKLYEQRGELGHAADTLARLVEVRDDARKHELYWRLGRIHAQLGDTGAAETSLSRGLALDARHVPTMEALIEIYAHRGDWQKAAHMMVRAESHAQLAIDKVRLLCEAANIHLYKLGAPDRAQQLYAAAIALDPEHVDAGRQLAEMLFAAGDWAALLPVIAMLCRKSARLRLEPQQLHALHYRAARCAAELGEHAKARDYYKTAYELDSTHVPTLTGRADLAFDMHDWDDAGRLYQALLVQHRDVDHVRIYHRLGLVRRALGDRKQALQLFEKVLELDPQHRDTLNAVVELHAQLGDLDAVVRGKRALATTATAHDKAKLLEEVGTHYLRDLKNAPKAIATYVEALQHAPADHQLLQKLLDLYIETKQWKQAVAAIERFVDLERDPFRRGVYFHAAATICRDELKTLDSAVAFYECALDSFFAEPERLDDKTLPRALMSFEAIDHLLTAQRDWNAQERAYRDMILRLPKDDSPRFHKLQISLIDALGEIYRSRLKQYDEAAAAFAIAQELDPDNAPRAEILAELYVLAGTDHADKAVAQHALMLRNEPFKYDSYKALGHVYRATQQWDKYWCLCSTLAFLRKADADELQFYEQHKPRGLVKAKHGMSADSWGKLAHADENRYISAIFGACWHGVAAMKAFTHKELGLRREDRRELHGDSLMFSKLFVYAAQVLNVPLPDVYLVADDKTAELQLANATDRGKPCPSFVVRPHLLQGKTERELAFLSARRLAFMRPEYYLRMLLPTHTELKVALISAIAMVQPRFAVPPNLVATVQKYQPPMQKRLQPQALEQLGMVAERFIQATPEIDLAKWGQAADAASYRAGFIACGDLAVAARGAAADPVVVGGPNVKAKVRELVLFSISEEYFAIRKQLGLSIGA